ncbi:MAG TPA: nucleotidyltransferase domain-containing protein [Bacteroidales bacterium]|nr:nucleotidyltransferase domain-containing protein [Bacteroidales bacterium]
MNPNGVQEKIGKIVHLKDPNALVYLFGSRARGDFRPDSDWDLLILVDNETISKDVEDKFRSDLYDVELETGQIVSAFIYSKNYWRNTLIHTPLYKNVTREGILL